MAENALFIQNLVSHQLFSRKKGKHFYFYSKLSILDVGGFAKQGKKIFALSLSF
jgi:hypothetical protein